MITRLQKQIAEGTYEPVPYYDLHAGEEELSDTSDESGLEFPFNDPEDSFYSRPTAQPNAQYTFTRVSYLLRIVLGEALRSCHCPPRSNVQLHEPSDDFLPHIIRTRGIACLKPEFDLLSKEWVMCYGAHSR